jgi:hypothetical protein
MPRSGCSPPNPWGSGGEVAGDLLLAAHGSTSRGLASCCAGPLFAPCNSRSVEPGGLEDGDDGLVAVHCGDG